MTQEVVIIGAGVAGHSAAVGIRRAGSDAPITLIGAEPHAPYDRPAVSKAYLKGTRGLSELSLSPTGHYDNLGIRLRLAERVEQIDPEARRVILASGGDLSYGSLIVATGSAPIALPLAGFDRPEVLTMRSLADASVLRHRLLTQPRVAIIGAGLVGSELAASARVLGCEVALIDAGPEPLSRILGADLGAGIARLHAKHGVHLHMNAAVLEARGDGALEAIVLSTGDEIACDVAVVAIGARPDIALLAAAGARVAGGVCVDERGRTSLDHVYAAGDITRWRHPLCESHIRVEHFDNAVSQGDAVGRTLAGGEMLPPALPTFWTDQFDRSLLWAGFDESCDDVVFRGSLGTLDVTAFYLRDGRVRAIAAVDRPRDVRIGKKLIMDGRSVPASALANDGVDLATLLH